MANLVFSDLQNETYAHLGLDSTDSTNQTNVNRWLNYSQQDICSRWPWTFMVGREAITTVPDYQTGTVSVSGTTVTGSGTSFSSSVSNGQYYIQFSGSNDWFRITARGSGTSLTIEQAPSLTVSGSAYIVRQFFYSLSSSADRIIDIRNWQTPLRLVQVDPRSLDDIRPNPQSTNTSYGYLAWGYDASANIQVSPYPFPSDARALEIRTMKRPVDMANANDIVSIPNKYAHLISWGAIAIGYYFLRKVDIAKEWSARYEERIQQMKSEYKMTEDFSPGFRSIDSIQRSKWIQLPENFPVITS